MSGRLRRRIVPVSGVTNLELKRDWLNCHHKQPDLLVRSRPHPCQCYPGQDQRDASEHDHGDALAEDQDVKHDRHYGQQVAR